MNHKKLKISVKKGSNNQQDVKKEMSWRHIDGAHMNESEKETYLGDFLTRKANSKDKIEARKARGYGILGEIGAML